MYELVTRIVPDAYLTKVCYNSFVRILVTGGTGFIGTSLVRHLVAQHHDVRILLRPSRKSPKLPISIPIEVAVSGLNEERGLRAALKGVDLVFHLASSERRGSHANLYQGDIEGTMHLLEAVKKSDVNRIVYLSHLGSDKASAYPVLHAKGLIESAIQESGIPYSIMRLGNVYGPGDQFTTQINQLIKVNPFFFFLPGGGDTLLQPLWIEDVISVLIWIINDDSFINTILSFGGIEQISYRSIVELIMKVTGRKRLLVSVSPAYLRPITLFIEQIFGKFPISLFWLDTLAADRTCAVNNLPQLFGLLPARLETHLEYLKKPY